MMPPRVLASGPKPCGGNDIHNESNVLINITLFDVAGQIVIDYSGKNF